MQDLDSLLEDLGRGKSTSSMRKERPPSSRVDLNELEDLMEDLAAPTARATHAVPKAQPVSFPGGGSNAAKAAPAPAPAPAPVQPAKPAQPAPVQADDDLDALMASLSATSTRPAASSATSSSSAQPKPVSAPKAAAPAAPKFAAPAAPKVAAFNNNNHNSTSNSNYNSPPAAAAVAPVQQQKAAPAGSSDLDALLGNLTQQMSNIDSTNPASRGTCGTCAQPILGQVVNALGRTYHPEHFVCQTCRMPLGQTQFFELNNQPTCQSCHGNAAADRCGHCNQPVSGRLINALGKKWHPEHFICTQCTQPFAGGQFFERDGKPYCENDFYDLFAPKCGSCQQAIRGDCINALGKQWHPEHFVCNTCGKNFGSGSFFEHDGMPFCDQHYHNQTNSFCGGCNKPITDRAVNALGKKWHPEHFVCAFCMNPLAGGNFSEQNGKAYCGECHGKLFS